MLKAKALPFCYKALYILTETSSFHLHVSRKEKKCIIQQTAPSRTEVACNATRSLMAQTQDSEVRVIKYLTICILPSKRHQQGINANRARKWVMRVDLWASNSHGLACSCRGAAPRETGLLGAGGSCKTQALAPCWQGFIGWFSKGRQ